MITTAEIQGLTIPIFEELLEALGQPLTLIRETSGGAYTLDSRRESSSSTLWSGRGILVPLTDKQAQEAGSTTPVPLQQLFFPADAPVGQPGFTVHDPVSDLRFRPTRDAINWKDIFWDLLVQAPGERSQ